MGVDKATDKTRHSCMIKTAANSEQNFLISKKWKLTLMQKKKKKYYTQMSATALLHNRQNLETSQMSPNRWMDKQAIL